MKINYVFKRIIIVSKRILLIILILSLFQMIFLPRLLFADTSIEKIKLTNKYCQSSVPWENDILGNNTCLLYTSPSPRDGLLSRMPSSA